MILKLRFDYIIITIQISYSYNILQQYGLYCHNMFQLTLVETNYVNKKVVQLKDYKPLELYLATII